MITLIGSGSVDIIKNEVYIDSGATASDTHDGNLTSSVSTGGTFTDTSSTGSFTIIYNVSDIAGNTAT